MLLRMVSVSGWLGPSTRSRSGSSSSADDREGAPGQHDCGHVLGGRALLLVKLPVRSQSGRTLGPSCASPAAHPPKTFAQGRAQYLLRSGLLRLPGCTDARCLVSRRQHRGHRCRSPGQRSPSAVRRSPGLAAAWHAAALSSYRGNRYQLFPIRPRRGLSPQG
jgi:hypothetical protein